MASDTKDFDVIVMGGGPAGAAAARLLAAWGHSVLVLARPIDEARGLAESIPPSAQKLFAAIGVQDEVERAGFYRASGNTVWWGSQPQRVERFDPAGSALGLQVFRPDLDRLLRASAARAGAQIANGALARDVQLEVEDGAAVGYVHDSRPARARARYLLDCTGRRGIVARQGFRRHEIGRRMQALVGIWDRDTTFPSPRVRGEGRGEEWGLEDETHTLVESYADGWSWSVPVSPLRRHVGVMVDGAASRLAKASRLSDVYEAEIRKTRKMAPITRRGRLTHVWACDAAVYHASTYAGTRHLLVGDAGSFIDPLSSFGVKKALASAWLAAIAVHTALVDPDRRAVAFDFFSRREREMYAAHLRRAGRHARDARAEHAEPFWMRQGSPGSDRAVDGHVAADTADDPDDHARLRDPLVVRALGLIRDSAQLDLTLSPVARLAPQPIVRGREIVLEPALALRDRDSVRFLNGVDLVRLAGLAARHRHVPDLHASYCRVHAPVPLPPVIGGLAFLLAHGVLVTRTTAPAP